MTTCPQCGRTYSDDTHACPVCGAGPGSDRGSIATDARGTSTDLPTLERQLETAEQTIQAIENGLHPGVSSAKERFVAAENRWKSLDAERSASAKRWPVELADQIEVAAYLRETSEAAVCAQFPSIHPEILAAHVRLLREFQAAIGDRLACRAAFEEKVVNESAPLRAQRTELVKSIIAARRRLDDQRWSEAESRGTMDALRNYLEAFPSGAHIAEARRGLDDLIWEEARAKRTEEALRKYLNQPHAGAHADDAIELIDEIRDDRAWAQARQANNVDGYAFYIRNQPAGRHLAEAEQQLQVCAAARRRRQIWIGAGLVAALGVMVPWTWDAYSRAKLTALRATLQQLRPEDLLAVESALERTSVAPWHREQAAKLKAEFEKARLEMEATNAVAPLPAIPSTQPQINKPAPVLLGE